VLINVADAKSVLTGKEMTLHVMLVDDHVLVRKSLVRLIQREPDFEIVGESSNGKSAVKLVRKIRPEVVIMDINMPEMNGIEAAEIIHNEFPSIFIIGFSIYEEEAQKEAMLKAGATAYLCKQGSSKALIETIRGCFK
jgi:two-component system response regulator DegU